MQAILYSDPWKLKIFRALLALTGLVLLILLTGLLQLSDSLFPITSSSTNSPQSNADYRMSFVNNNSILLFSGSNALVIGLA